MNVRPPGTGVRVAFGNAAASLSAKLIGKNGSRWFTRRAPGALEPWLRRETIRAQEEQLLASHPATLQIRPPTGSAGIGRTERRPHLLRAAVHAGRQATLNELAGCVEEHRVTG